MDDDMYSPCFVKTFELKANENGTSVLTTPLFSVFLKHVKKAITLNSAEKRRQYVVLQYKTAVSQKLRETT